MASMSKGISKHNIKKLLEKETAVGAFQFMNSGGKEWMKVEGSEEGNDIALHLVIMKFLPAAHEPGGDALGPSRTKFVNVVADAFGTTEYSVRKHVWFKDFQEKLAGAMSKLLGEAEPAAVASNGTAADTASLKLQRLEAILDGVGLDVQDPDALEQELIIWKEAAAREKTVETKELLVAEREGELES